MSLLAKSSYLCIADIEKMSDILKIKRSKEMKKHKAIVKYEYMSKCRL